MTKHTKTLDERIAYTLKGDNEIASAEIGELLADVEAAAKAADETASKAHREALDPTRIVDAKSVAATVAAAALHTDIKLRCPASKNGASKSRKRSITGRGRRRATRFKRNATS